MKAWSFVWDEKKNPTGMGVFCRNSSWRYSSFLLWRADLLYPSLTCDFTFHSFSYPGPTVVWKYSMENSRNKQCICFKLHAILTSMMPSLNVLLYPASLCPAFPCCTLCMYGKSLIERSVLSEVSGMHWGGLGTYPWGWGGTMKIFCMFFFWKT